MGVSLLELCVTFVKPVGTTCLFVLFVRFLNVLVLPILRATTHETELGQNDFCLSWSHYTDTDPTSRERAATAGIKPGTSSPGVACSTDWATAPRGTTCSLSIMIDYDLHLHSSLSLDFYSKDILNIDALVELKWWHFFLRGQLKGLC